MAIMFLLWIGFILFIATRTKAQQEAFLALFWIIGFIITFGTTAVYLFFR